MNRKDVCSCELRLAATPTLAMPTFCNNAESAEFLSMPNAMASYQLQQVDETENEINFVSLVSSYERGFQWKPWKPPWIHHCIAGPSKKGYQAPTEGEKEGKGMELEGEATHSTSCGFSTGPSNYSVIPLMPLPCLCD